MRFIPSIASRSFALGLAACFAAVTFAAVTIGCDEPSDTESTGEAKPAGDVDAKEKSNGIVSKAEWGKEKLKLEFLQRKVAKDPCDKRNALDLAEKFNRVKEYELAIAVVDTYWGKCDPWVRLLWPKSVALRYLKRFSEGAPVVTKLIEADKPDSDYWWWRGRHYAQAKDIDRAEADFRQSNANKPSGYGSGKMSGYLGDERPCEAAFLISRYIEQTSKKVGDWAAPARTKHWVAGNCDALAGKGSTTMRFRKTAPVKKANIRVGGKKAKAIVDTKAAFTAVSKSFAFENEWKPGAEVQALVVGQLVSGHLTSQTVSIGKASADKVKILIVDELPGGGDAIVGQSFFVRFKNVDKEGSLRLSAR